MKKTKLFHRTNSHTTNSNTLRLKCLKKINMAPGLSGLKCYVFSFVFIVFLSPR